jgi:hypothetical protein
MAGFTAHGARVTFLGFAGDVTGISVETPKAQVTDMTAVGDGLGHNVMVPTGEWSGGTITVDFLTVNFDPQAFVKLTGQLTFASPGYTVSRRVICESASIGAQAGELVRGSLKFLMTDYTGA